MDRLRRVSGCAWVAVLLASPANILAASPLVRFDAPLLVACREVTSAEGNLGGDRLIEARFEVSSLLVAGEERDLVQYFIRVEGPERQFTVVDYVPKTLHDSPLAGFISQQDTTEKSASLGISLSGKYEFLPETGLTAGLSKKQTSCVKYELLPPLETVAASGTLARGRGAFFKLKASPRHPLEGSRELGLVLRVPANWRAGYVRLQCEADAIARGLVSQFDSRVSAGKQHFLIGLYWEGDLESRHAAEQIVRVRQQEEAAARSASRSSPYSLPWTLDVK